MGFEHLLELASQTLETVDHAPAHLPDPLVYVIQTTGGKTYTVINDDFAHLPDTLRAEGDTTVLAVLAMWKGGQPDLPSYAFRTALRRLNPANSETELFLGSVTKKLWATMRHPRFDLLSLNECPELLDSMALWFHQKWGIPESAYRESMEESLRTAAPIPRWYAVLDGEEIIGGVGVIENDFHLRRDLTPNVCALYVEEAHRNQGIAEWMLTRVCNEYAAMGVHTLYLATEHTSFYERYGWEFHCLAQEEDSEHMTRMYRKVTG